MASKSDHERKKKGIHIKTGIKLHGWAIKSFCELKILSQKYIYDGERKDRSGERKESETDRNSKSDSRKSARDININIWI